MSATTSAVPEFIRAAASSGGLTAQLANAFMPYETALRQMCFLDNQYGPRAGYEVSIFSQRVIAAINKKYADNGRRVRVLNVSPMRSCYHHIAIDFGDVLPDIGLASIKRVVFNLYPLSKRKVEDSETSNDPIANSSNPRGQRVSAPARGAGRHGTKMTMREFKAARAAEIGG
jgi:hypothetical protein